MSEAGATGRIVATSKAGAASGACPTGACPSRAPENEPTASATATANPRMKYFRIIIDSLCLLIFTSLYNFQRGEKQNCGQSQREPDRVPRHRVRDQRRTFA